MASAAAARARLPAILGYFVRSTGLSVEPYVMLLDPGAPGGFVLSGRDCRTGTTGTCPMPASGFCSPA